MAGNTNWGPDRLVMLKMLAEFKTILDKTSIHHKPFVDYLEHTPNDTFCIESSQQRKDNGGKTEPKIVRTRRGINAELRRIEKAANGRIDYNETVDKNDNPKKGWEDRVNKRRRDAHEAGFELSHDNRIVLESYEIKVDEGPNVHDKRFNGATTTRKNEVDDSINNMVLRPEAKPVVKQLSFLDEPLTPNEIVAQAVEYHGKAKLLAMAMAHPIGTCEKDTIQRYINYNPDTNTRADKPPRWLVRLCIDTTPSLKHLKTD